MAFKMNGFSAFTIDYKDELAKLAYQLKNAKNENEALVIQNKIKDLQNKMNKEGAGGETKTYSAIKTEEFKRKK